MNLRDWARFYPSKLAKMDFNHSTREAPTTKNGYSLSLQPHFLAQLCKHGITLFDHCDTCQVGTEPSKNGQASSAKYSSKLTEKTLEKEKSEKLKTR